ncbi:hypothetical protein [Nesterenkonia sp. K-15-9-6]|uniref:hypothetical protein n=1 Tax=Nesterenkonia sp. K-15-9-6 TaxID=3093918 RepID=UPI0040448B3C
MLLYRALEVRFEAHDPTNQVGATVLSIIIALLVLGPITQWFGKDFAPVWAMAKR